MKYAFGLVLMVLSTPVFSAEAVNESRFHLLTTKCEVEANEGPEATPQSPPLEVDDPSTPGCNRWEINLVVGGDLTGSQTSWKLPLLDLNYGIGDNIQLKYEVPYVTSVSPDSSVAALGESEAGVKVMFFEDEPSKTQIATYPQVTFAQANSDAVAKGLATPGVIVTLPVLLSTKVGATSRGDLNLTANLGYNVSTKADTADFVSASVGLGTPVLNNLSIMGELTTEQALSGIGNEARSQLLRADVGVMTTISRRFILFGALGHSLVASDSLDHTYALAGFRLIAGGASADSEKVASR